MNPSLPDNTPSDNQHIIDQIDGFIKNLNAPEGTTVAASVVTKTLTIDKPEPPVVAPKTDDEMKAFILQHSAELVNSSVKSIQELQKVTVATGDPEMMASLASLIAASTGAIETVNKMYSLNKKSEAALELKRVEIEGRKEVQRIKNDGNLLLPPNQTNILVATREEIIQQLTGKAKDAAKNVLEIEASQ